MNWGDFSRRGTRYSRNFNSVDLGSPTPGFSHGFHSGFESSDSFFEVVFFFFGRWVRKLRTLW